MFSPQSKGYVRLSSSYWTILRQPWITPSGIRISFSSVPIRLTRPISLFFFLQPASVLIFLSSRILATLFRPRSLLLLSYWKNSDSKKSRDILIQMKSNPNMGILDLYAISRYGCAWSFLKPLWSNGPFGRWPDRSDRLRNFTLWRIIVHLWNSPNKNSGFANGPWR